MNTPLNTPILFIIFNRPESTSEVFDVIKKHKPHNLFLAADGPRGSKEGEANLCELTRKLVLENIDWDCNLTTLFRDENLGCKVAVSTAITWFFNNVEQGIILEDDCVPSTTFFSFCEAMLNKYRNDESVMHIGGTNFLDDKIAIHDSYYFSKMVHIWGWATWR
jgi:hypothetical protein